MIGFLIITIIKMSRKSIFFGKKKTSDNKNCGVYSRPVTIYHENPSQQVNFDNENLKRKNSYLRSFSLQDHWSR